MPTSRELLEAHSFLRRRVVRAFESGSQEGPVVEPIRSAPWIAASAALALALVLGEALLPLLLAGGGAR